MFSYIQNVGRDTLKMVGASAKQALGFMAVCAALAVSFIPTSAWATGSTLTIPDLGFSISDAITTAIAAMGAVAFVAVGGYFAFTILKFGLGWIGTSFGRAKR